MTDNGPATAMPETSSTDPQVGETWLDINGDTLRIVELVDGEWPFRGANMATGYMGRWTRSELVRRTDDPADARPTTPALDLAAAVRDCIIALKHATERSIERLDAVISNLEGQQ